MKLDAKHYEAIQRLIEHPFTGQTLHQLADELGVDTRTLRRWRSDPDFQAAYRAALAKWNEDMGDLRFVHRRARVEELHRLYDAASDRLDEKLKILQQIRDEVEPRLMRGFGREKTASGERIVVFEVGVAPGAQEDDGLPPEIPWGDGGLMLAGV